VKVFNFEKIEVMVFYTSDGKETFGPFSLEELKEQELVSTSLVYSEGTQWVKAIDLPELADFFKAKVPPPPHIPPPPPVHLVNQNVYQSKISNDKPFSFDFSQVKDKAWIVALVVFLIIGGFGVNYYQNVKETARLEAEEVASKELKKQEEAAKAEEQRIKEVEGKIAESKERLATLQGDLAYARRNQREVEEFDITRTPKQGREQKAEARREVNRIQKQIDQEKKRIEDLEAMLY